MADMVEIEGLRELAETLRKLPEKVSKSALRAGVYAGAKVIQAEAKRRAPMYHGQIHQGHPPPGTLKRSIIIKQIREQSGPLQQVYYVTVRHGHKYRNQGKKGNLSQDAFYWWWVEFGHWVNTTGRALTGRRAVKDRRRDAAINAGHDASVPPHPFMRPAFETRKTEAVEAMKRKLEERIAELANK